MSRSISFKIHLSILALLLGACGGGGGGSGSNDSGDNNRTPVDVVQITFTPVVKNILPSQSLRLSVHETSTNKQHFDNTVGINSDYQIKLDPGKYQFVVSEVPDGYQCSADIENASQASGKHLVIDCQSVITYFDIKVNLGESFDYTGIVANVIGIASESPSAPVFPLVDVDVSEGNQTFNGKTYEGDPVELRAYEREGVRTAFKRLDIRADVRTTELPDETFLADQSGNLKISFDSRLFDAENLEKVPLLIVELGCGVDLSPAITCQLPGPVHVVLSPIDFMSGNWGAHALTEAMYRKLGFYLDNGTDGDSVPEENKFTVEEMKDYLNSLSAYVFNQDVSDNNYSDLLAWNADGSEDGFIKSIATVKDLGELLKQVSSPANEAQINEYVQAVMSRFSLNVQLSGMLQGQEIKILIRDNEDDLVDSFVLAQTESGLFEDITTLSKGNYHFSYANGNNDGSELLLGYDCALELLKNNQIIVKTLAVTCVDDLVDSLQVRLNLNEAIDLTGVEVKLDGLIAETISAEIDNLYVTVTDGDVINEPGQPRIVAPADIRPLTVASVRTSFDVYEISTQVRTPGTQSLNFAADSSGNVAISFDSRLLGANFGEQIPLVVASFYCPERDADCKLGNPIRVVLSPDAFITGAWKASILTEVAYQHLSYYVAAGYSFAELTTEMDHLAEIIFEKPSSKDTVNYNTLLGWDPFVNGALAQIKRPERLASVYEALQLDQLQLKQSVSALLTPVAASFSLSGGAQEVIISDNFAYVASGSGGLRKIDVAKPTDFPSNGSYMLTGDALDVAVYQGRAYVANDDNGVQVFDVSEGVSIVPLGRYPLIGAEQVQIQDGYLFAAGDDGLKIFNLAQPIGSNAIGEIDNTCSTQIEVSSENVFLSCLGGSPISIYDVSNKTAPSYVGNAMFGEYIASFDVADSYLYQMDAGTGLAIADISDPSNPQWLNSLEDIIVVKQLIPGPITVHDGMAYIADGGAGVLIVDVSNPRVPVVVDRLLVPGGAKKIVHSEGYGYILTLDNKLVTLNVESPSPVLSGDAIVRGSANRAAIVGNELFVSYDGYSVVYHNGIEVFSLEDSAMPVKTDQIDSHLSLVYSGYLCLDHQVAVYNQYIVSGCNRSYVVEFYDAATHALAGSVAGSGFDFKAANSDNVLFISDGMQSLVAVDTTQITNIVKLDALDTFTSAKGIAVIGNIVYVADGIAGLRIVDASNLQSLKSISTLGLAGEATQLALQGNRLYVAAGSAGIYVLDISNPTQPSILKQFPSLSTAFDIQLHNGFLYVASGNEGMAVLDAREGSPILIGKARTKGIAYDVLVQDEYSYLSTDYGLEVLKTIRPN